MNKMCAMVRLVTAVTPAFVLFVHSAFAAEDLVIADFEGDGYGDWTVEGEAFGNGPELGTLPGQRTVAGFLGGGLVNSFADGGDGGGKLISPVFTLERKYLNFLIGGGYVGNTSFKLFVSGDDGWEAVETVQGRSYAIWKTQVLRWESWDVSQHQGLEARIEIADDAPGEEGFIVIDHIIQSDEDFTIPLQDFTKDLDITQDFLHFPVGMDAPSRLVKLQRDGKSLREFEIQFASDDPDFWVYLEMHEFRGETLTLSADRRRYETANVLGLVSEGSEPKNFDTYYKEALRPQFHYSSPRGWNNDPNGMVYYDGEYHLFYQRNPFGWDWGNMTWGHAVSTDMVHWKNLPDALHPDASGTMFSGTAVVDKKNVAGFKTGDEDPILLFYTSAGGTNPWSKDVPHTQSIAYSNDRGRTFVKYAGNPIVDFIEKGNRDPKVLWHEPSQQWCMVLFIHEDELGFFTSDNLKDWTEQSRVKGFFECPELFELPVDGDPNNMKWVLYGALGDYMIGEFDGKEFKPETEIIKYSHSLYFYASQTFNDIPEEDGRRIQIGWARYMDMPGMPFNQLMNFPVALTLKTTDDGIRMWPMPVREIETLYKNETTFEEKSIKPGENLLSGINGDLLDIDADIEVSGVDRIGFKIRGIDVVYDSKEMTLTCVNRGGEGVSNKLNKDQPSGKSSASLDPIEGRIQLRILVDKTFIEIFANNGEVFMPMAAFPGDGQDEGVALFAEGGTANVRSLVVRELDTVW
jgi:fructan beta-fructosidase